MTRQAVAAQVAAVVIIGVVSVTLALQGWRSELPSDDSVPYIDAVHELLVHGEIPRHGNGTHFSSFTPPGFAWVVLPGGWFFADPRLWNVPGSVILHLATLAGIFLLARSSVGVRIAFLSVLFYGVSWTGLKYAAGGYETRGLPVFYVWMACWTCWWVARRDARYLFGAIVTWLLGMYVHMEMAPALFMVPVAWACYRPPVRVSTLVLAGALGLLIWFPYLQFEMDRGFVDVKSQVLLQPLEPESPPPRPECEGVLTLSKQASAPTESASVADVQPANRSTIFVLAVGRRVSEGVLGLFSNFNGLVPGHVVILLTLMLTGLLILSSARSDTSLAGVAAGGHVGPFSSWPTWLAVGLITCSAIGNEALISRILGSPLPDAGATILVLQCVLALAGAALLMRGVVARAVRPLAASLDDTACDPRVLVIALVVPWSVLLLVTEIGRLYRLQGLWPLQVIVLASSVSLTSARIGGHVRWIAPVLVTGLLAANPLVVSHLEGWWRQGWSGTDPVELEVVDYLAGRIAAEDRDRAVIGYAPLVGQNWRPISSEYVRTGSTFTQQVDVMLERRHGITNISPCAGRLSADDEYRVVETVPREPDERYSVDVVPTGDLRLLDRIGTYEVYAIDR